MVALKAPYVSGFLAFREVPFLVELVQRLQEQEPGLMPQVGALALWPEEGYSSTLKQGMREVVAVPAGSKERF